MSEKGTEEGEGKELKALCIKGTSGRVVLTHVL